MLQLWLWWSMVGVVFYLALNLLAHVSLFRTAVHPFWLARVIVTGDMKGGAHATYRTSFVAFLSSKFACPAAVGAPVTWIWERHWSGKSPTTQV